MKYERFVFAIPRYGQLAPGDRETVRRVAGRLGPGAEPRLRRCACKLTGEPPIVLTDDDCTLLLLGRVFRKERGGRVEALSTEEREELIATRGAILFDRFWGDYLAVLERPDGVDILRAPFGERSLVWGIVGGTVFIASDLKTLAACGGDVRTIDWRQVARHLAEPDIRRDATCLVHVNELRGGNRLTVAQGGIAIETLWSPWRSERLSNGRDESADLRATIDRCVAEKIGAYRHPLLLLSGGLDSSILAAALAQTGKPLSALNLVTEDRSGDERRYAATVAAAFGIDYFEERRSTANVDPLRSAATWLPRPSLRSFLQDSAALTAGVTARAGCDVIVEGSGGDNVFCSLQSVAPVADLIRSGSSVRAIVASASAIAQLTDATLLTVLRRALYRAFLRAEPYRVRPDHSFLSKAGVELSAGATAHPWLEGAAGKLPGKVGHAAMLAAAQGWAECLDPSADRPTLGPLLAQPIVEACFVLPTWQWFAHGQNRVIAREAYRHILPDLIVDRRSKATPDSFVTQVFNEHRPRLAEFLLDGALAREGLLDRAALAGELCRSGPPRDHAHRRIMRIADVEAWLQGRPGPASASSRAGAIA